MGVIFFVIPIFIGWIIGLSFLQMKLLSYEHKLYGWILPIASYVFNCFTLGAEYENFEQAILYVIVSNSVSTGYFGILYAIHRIRNKEKYDEDYDVEPYINTYNNTNSPSNLFEYKKDIYQNSNVSDRTRLNNITLKMLVAILLGLLFPVFIIVYFGFMLNIEILIPLSFIIGLLIYILMTYKDLKEALGSKLAVHILVALISIIKLGEWSFMVPFLVSVVFIGNTSIQIMMYYRKNPNRIDQVHPKKPFPIKIVLIVGTIIGIMILIGAYIVWTHYFKEDTVYELNSISVSSPHTFTYQTDNHLYDKKNNIVYTIEVVSTSEYYLDLIEAEFEQAALDKNVQDCYSLASTLADSSNVNVMTVSVVTFGEDGTIDSYDQIYYDIAVKKLEDGSFEAVSFFEKNGYVVKMVAVYDNEASRDLIHDEFKNFIDTIIV